MDGLIDIASARALVADAALWPRLRDFLWNFPAQIHPTWLATIPAIPSGLSVPSSPRLARWLASEFSIEPFFHPFPSTDLSRLLLLDAATLESIALWIGALSTADALRRVTAAPAVRALKTALPGIYPDLFAYTAYFAKTLPPTAPDATPEAIRALGFTLLFSALADLPVPLLQRLRIKLPSDIPPPPDHSTDKPSNHQTAKPSYHQTIQLLTKLRFPEAHALCFS